MESGWTQDLLNWVTANPGWSGLIVFLIAFVESLLVIGFLVPGIFIIFGVGAVVGLGDLSIWPIWIGGSVGAYLGDIVSFWIGRRFGTHLADFWPFTRWPEMLERGTEFFEKQGSRSVVAGRFIGPLRPIIPACAGMLGMSPARFNTVCIPACIVWTPAYLVPGMLFGASLEVAAEYAGRLTVVLAAVVAIIWLTFWGLRTLYIVFAVNSARWMRHAIRWTRRHPHWGRIIGPIVDPSRPEALSVSMLGLLLVVALWALAFLLFLSPFGSQPEAIDQAVLAWSQSLRNHIADPPMVAISQLSRMGVLLLTAFATLLWLLGAGRRTAAVHWLIAIVGGLALQYLVGLSLRSTPSIHAAGNEQWFHPSADMTLAVVVLGFFCVMVARELRRRSRKWPYLVTALLITLLFSARIYLGLDWLSGALVGLFLGLSWTAIVGIAYRSRAQWKFSGTIASLIFFATLAATMTWQVREHMQSDLAALRLPLPEQTMAMKHWWSGGWSELPAERTRYQSVAARRFNLQVVMPPTGFQSALEQRDWTASEPPDWNWPLRALNPEPDETNLPLFSKDYLGHPEVLVMRDPLVTPGLQQVIRLWDSGTRVQPGNRVLYLGQYSEDTLVQRLKLFSYWRAAPLQDADFEAFASSLGEFEVQQVSDDVLLIRLPAPLESSARLPTGVADDPPGQ